MQVLRGKTLAAGQNHTPLYLLWWFFTSSTADLGLASSIAYSHAPFKVLYGALGIDEIKINVFHSVRRPRPSGQEGGCTAARVWFESMGVEANFGFYKLSKRFGFSQPIITADNIEPPL